MSAMARYALAGSLILGTALGTTACSDDSSTGADDSTTGELINSSESSEPIYDENGNIISSASGDVTPVDPNNPAPLSSAGVVDPNNPSPNSNGSTEPTPVDPNNPVPTSSAGVITEPSSSALKEYDDNHAPKESFLPPAGFYTSLTIDPPTPQKGGQIKCTFDGSFPTQNSESITAAKPITENTVIRCSEFVNGQAADTTTQTYFINESVTMPVVALTVNHHDMFDSTDGLYATGPLTNNQGGGMWDIGGFGATDNNNPKCSEPCKQANFWKDTELPVHVEFFENGSSTKTKNWEFDAGISIIGNYSRYKPKKSVAIKMDNDNYGDKTLKYSLFKTRPEAKKFKAFNLRNNGNRFVSDYIEDPMAVSLLEGTHVDYQRSRQVVVFYNGVYYGIHDMREKLNEHFVETNYGIDSKGVDVIKHTNTDISASGGTSEGYISMLNYAVNNDLTIDANYITLGTMLDIASYVDYMAAEIYYHNGDWPNNNLRAWHSVEQPWKFMAFDIDHGFDWTWNVSGFGQSTNIFTWIKNGGTTSGSCYKSSNSLCFHNLYNNIIKNENFRRTFINRAAVLYNSFVNSAKVETAVDKMVSTMPISDITRDMNKFPRAQLWYTNSCNNGFEYTGSCLKTWSRSRDSKVIQEFQNEFGLESLVKMTISATGLGTVLLDDIALPSQSYTGNFFNGHPMKLTASGNGGIFVEWEDGSTQNPRFVYASAGATYTAKFK